MMPTIATVLGARPQFIKASAVSAVLAKEGVFREVVIHTGQHYDAMMSDVFFHELQIPAPTYNLNIGSAPHGEQTGRMLEGTERILLTECPDLVLVYGDTNSTLAGALAAAKLRVPVAHIEAGMRSFNRSMPEEINRVVTDHVSSLLFAPSEQAREHLLMEGVSRSQIEIVGDVMLDVALKWREAALRKSNILKSLGIRGARFVLATIHRAQATDDPVVLGNVMRGLAELGEEILVVFPVHPRTRVALGQRQLQRRGKVGVLLIEPVGFFDMIVLEHAAALVVTDSGGVQKEAFFHRTRCVTLRSETEWKELVGAGVNTTVDPKAASDLGKALRTALAAPEPDWGEIPAFYGHGDSAMLVSRRLRREFGIEE